MDHRIHPRSNGSTSYLLSKAPSSSAPRPSKPKAYSPRSLIMSESQKLELENLRMEERLNALRDEMKALRDSRSQKSSLWKSAQSSGSLSRYAQEARKRAPTKDSDPGKRNEDGLAMPMWNVTIPTTASNSRPQTPNSSTSYREPNMQQLIEDSLLDGPCFSESDSRASFLEALDAWRSGSTSTTSASVTAEESKTGNIIKRPDTQASSTQHSSTTTTTTSVSPTLSSVVIPSSTSGMSYKDKLLLARLRKDSKMWNLQ
ncbi:hypothetical protein SeMB42_g03355 [Synchytrium endobioticum]|uniref:Uncharacterized protein n=1 Tax=Synchytrium endobioticum TaxID=286115 RepID=A0A507D725_9FUNG|nr:hypothetical protein SeMB42_g03355 [Synchytrium endobioticum]TPX48577.1 hypothetical protein SeLEV6574_g01945 [Synchytrium endobioticum]